MTDETLSAQWSERFGLARSPMFTREENGEDGQHEVLLDGGYGSFGISVVEDGIDPAVAAGWAWSSDLPHHVTISKKGVQVVRWDALTDAQVYTLPSVTRDLDRFYRFLCRDRLRSNRTVVQHLVSLSLVAHAKFPDERAIDAFVTVLADLIADENAPADAGDFGLPDDAADLRAALAGASLDEALRDIRAAPATLSALKLHPNLAIRHAGGQLFQEAHFDLVRAPPPDLFGYVDTVTSERNSRGGTHFTPPALARSIVDHTLLQIGDLKARPRLTISDPACGSAAFLHEALRGLQRVGFSGVLRIVGRDISAPAIAMARFTLTLAKRDWAPAGGVTLDLRVGDSLAEQAFPSADVTVMNPPFISVIAQMPKQKEQLRAVVGDKVGSRGDYSMAFVTKALEALANGGALGTLFPANLLTHEAANPWRERLARDGNIRLLASIGDFGLFSQALVHIACVVITKGQPHHQEFTALVTGNEPGATGDALRALRKTHGAPPTISVGDRQWKLFATDSTVLDRKLPWRILTPQQRGLLDALEAAQTPTAGELFDIAQGVQTGNLKVFLLDDDDFRRLGLPAKERRYFRDALMTDSIDCGRIVKNYHLFFPHGADGPLFRDEAELAAAVPNYYRTMLKPNEAALKGRASILQANRKDWWGLMRPRTNTFALNNRPRIVSKFFGSEGSFALDPDGRYLPSTGHVWTPKGPICADNQDEEAEIAENSGEGVGAAASIEVMRAYVALLNSSVFVRLVSFRSVTIAGGQFDLSSRFIAPVFLPNLWEKAVDPIDAGQVRHLARIALAAERGEVAQAADLNQVVAKLYGVPELAES
jgi:adenine-specific DNA-methyltransferase